MTLVVCRIEGDDLFVHSDSKLTDSMGSGTERQLSQRLPLSGTLKTVFLHRHVCLSFAGHSAYAIRFLKYFMSTSLSDWTTSRLISALRDIHQSSRHECEFLVCTAFNRKPAIATIKNGTIEDGLASAWIGSADGFEAYQRAYHLSQNPRTRERMTEAFRAVIDDEAVPEVGHFHIQAYIDHDALEERADSIFMYEFRHESDSGSEVQHIAANTPTQITMGSAAYGAYGTSYFRSVSTAKHGVAIHLTHADIGVFWCPQVDCENAIVIRNCGPRAFLEAIWDRYAVPMEGMTLENDAIRCIRNYRDPS